MYIFCSLALSYEFPICLALRLCYPMLSLIAHDKISEFLETLSEKVVTYSTSILSIMQKPAKKKKSSRAVCRMAYLRAQVTRCMLSYSIATSAATSSTVIINMASLMSTTTKEFTEKHWQHSENRRTATTTSNNKSRGGAWKK